MFNRARAILIKETRELIRDPIYLALALLVPVIVTFIIGAGMSMDVKNIPMAAYDHDRSAISREYISSFTNSEYFRLVGFAENAEQAEEWIARGNIRLLIEIPEDFSEKLTANQAVSVRASIDGSFPSRAEVVSGYVDAINFQTNNALLLEYTRVSGLATTTPSIVPIAVAWYNPTLESKNFLIPSLIAVNLMFYSSLLSALIIVKEKEIGTIYNLYCSPVKAWEVVLGKAVPYIVVSFIAYLLLFLLSVLVFEVKFSGNFIALSGGALLFLTSTIGYGLLISQLAPTQISAMFVALVSTLVPSFFYSGFLAPITSQTAYGQLISHFIPATYFMEIIRGIYLKGATLMSVYPSLLALALYAAAVYCLAIFSFRKKVS